MNDVKTLKLLWYNRTQKKLYAEDAKGKTIVFRVTRGGWQRMTVDKRGRETWKFAKVPLSLWIATAIDKDRAI